MLRGEIVTQGGATLAVPATLFAIALFVYIAAMIAERHIAWHRRKGWLEPRHPFWDTYWSMTPRWRRHRYNPELYEFDPRLDPILSIIRRMARMIMIISGVALLALQLFSA